MREEQTNIGPQTLVDGTPQRAMPTTPLRARKPQKEVESTPLFGQERDRLVRAKRIERMAAIDGSVSKRSGYVCQCADHGCPVHPGMDCLRVQTETMKIQRLYRIDMDDRTGTPMCDWCAEDALDSGVFTA